MMGMRLLVGALAIGVAGSAAAAPAFSCGGFAMLGGAELICSHVDPVAPTQICNFSWTLMGPTGQNVITGSFFLPPGVQNSTVYQGSGFTAQLTSPIVLCQGRSGQ